MLFLTSKNYNILTAIIYENSAGTNRQHCCPTIKEKLHLKEIDNTYLQKYAPCL